MPPAWAQKIDPIQGELVSVREVVDRDAPTLFEMLSDPIVAAQMSPPPPSVEAFRGFIAWAQQERSLGNAVCFGIVPPGLESAVGIIQVRAQEPSWFTAEWGFAIGAAFWSTGAFPDAAGLVAGFAFEHLGVHRIEARAMVGNGRGNGALQKFGARPEGALASSFARDGRYHPQFLWGLHADDWRQRPLRGPRFVVTDALASIEAATREISDRLRAAKPSRLGGDPPLLHPFFVWKPRPNPGDEH